MSQRKYDKPYRWPYDGDEQIKKCNRCGADIYFKRSKAGKWCAISYGTFHLHGPECAGRDERIPK